jgi:hypothetical protein
MKWLDLPYRLEQIGVYSPDTAFDIVNKFVTTPESSATIKSTDIDSQKLKAAIAHLRKILEEYNRPSFSHDGIPKIFDKIINDADIWYAQQTDI